MLKFNYFSKNALVFLNSRLKNMNAEKPDKHVIIKPTRRCERGTSEAIPALTGSNDG
jgi:hypothetical protein